MHQNDVIGPAAYDVQEFEEVLISYLLIG